MIGIVIVVVVAIVVIRIVFDITDHCFLLANSRLEARSSLNWDQMRHEEYKRF